MSDRTPIEFLDGAMEIGVLSWVREKAHRRETPPASGQPGSASRRAFISACSASSVATGKLQVWPWHSIAIGSSARGRSSRGDPFGHSRRSSRSTVSDGSGARSAAEASAWRPGRRTDRRRRPSRRAPACRRSSASADCRRALRARRRPRDEALGRIAPARFVSQMPKPDERLGTRRRTASPHRAPGAAARPARRRRLLR